MKVQEIRELIKLIDESSIEEFEYENDGAKVLMKKKTDAPTQVITTVVPEQVQAPVVQQASPVAQEAGSFATPAAEKVTANETANLHKIVSPMVGTFYSASSPDAEAFAKTGTKVDKDTVVCIVEAMKLFNEIEADVKGEIVEVLVQNGQLVEYGQPLFLVKAD